MIDYLLSRQQRKTKRELAARLYKQTHDLVETLRDTKEFLLELRDFYKSVGDTISAAHCESLLSSFIKPPKINVGPSNVENIARVIMTVLPEEKS